MFPHLLFDLCGLERMRYPEIWQCVGMIVGVYGVGYLIAAIDPHRHWPIVLVGLLGKILGPIGFAKALADGTFPPTFGLNILTNDLIWWIPFALILWGAFLNRTLSAPAPGTIRRFVKESRIAAPPAAVFHFHERPDALAHLTPPWEPMRVIQPPSSLQVGSRVILAGRVFGLPLRWVAIHTEYEPPRRFADRQQSGPFEHWYHRHEFVDDGAGGTLLRDEVEYVPPFGRVGGWLLDTMIQKKLARLFEYRHEVTRRLIGADPSEALK